MTIPHKRFPEVFNRYDDRKDDGYGRVPVSKEGLEYLVRIQILQSQICEILKQVLNEAKGQPIQSQPERYHLPWQFSGGPGSIARMFMNLSMLESEAWKKLFENSNKHAYLMTIVVARLHSGAVAAVQAILEHQYGDDSLRHRQEREVFAVLYMSRSDEELSRKYQDEPPEVYANRFISWAHDFMQEAQKCLAPLIQAELFRDGTGRWHI